MPQLVTAQFIFPHWGTDQSHLPLEIFPFFRESKSRTIEHKFRHVRPALRRPNFENLHRQKWSRHNGSDSRSFSKFQPFRKRRNNVWDASVWPDCVTRVGVRCIRKAFSMEFPSKFHSAESLCGLYGRKRHGKYTGFVHARLHMCVHENATGRSLGAANAEIRRSENWKWRGFCGRNVRSFHRFICNVSFGHYSA